MSLPALATIEDLEARFGETIANTTQATARLEDASAIVRAFAGRTWVDDEGELSGVPDGIPGVVASMVERATRNPEGATQSQEVVGPFSLNRSFGPDASARLYLTQMEKLVIRDAVGSRGIGIMAVTRGDLETPAVVECNVVDYTDDEW